MKISELEKEARLLGMTGEELWGSLEAGLNDFEMGRVVPFEKVAQDLRAKLKNEIHSLNVGVC